MTAGYEDDWEVPKTAPSNDIKRVKGHRDLGRYDVNTGGTYMYITYKYTRKKKRLTIDWEIFTVNIFQKYM